MLRAVLLLLVCALSGVAAFSAPACGAVQRRAVSASAVTMAHHVQKKATKKHNDRRPKKLSKADRNRTPPSFAVNPLAALQSEPFFTITAKASA
ncbi:hypothetical protein KFE25_012187 [Diacronema lutheri]|uniref:Uncharacterized protein n=1 Tax=Diacronema lutheri TaxID=2081491 RepID=A0A8J6C575_DIALT|nr:hypothetical protein KFE25_012187 [Diacronema lutheri]